MITITNREEESNFTNNQTESSQVIICHFSLMRVLHDDYILKIKELHDILQTSTDLKMFSWH